MFRLVRPECSAARSAVRSAGLLSGATGSVAPPSGKKNLFLFVVDSDICPKYTKIAENRRILRPRAGALPHLEMGVKQFACIQ